MAVLRGIPLIHLRQVVLCQGLVGGEQHLLLLLQRLHLRQVPDELVELVLVVQDVLKSCSMKQTQGVQISKMVHGINTKFTKYKILKIVSP